MVDETSNFCVVHFPDWRLTNPYQSLMGESLKDLGIGVEFINGHKRLISRIFQGGVDILHLHWVHQSLLSSNAIFSIWRSAVFCMMLFIIRLLGVKLVWTVHNLSNHERKQIAIEMFFSRWIARLSDAILVHGPSAVQPVCNYLKVSSQKVYAVPHGNYDHLVLPFMENSQTGNPVDSSRQILSVMYFGLIRSYKGIPHLINAFKRFPFKAGLMIAGKAASKSLQKEIIELSGDDERIVLKLEFLPDESLFRLISSADLVVLPFREVFTSGSLLLALTFGKPIVVPAVGLITDYVDESCAFLYDPQDDSGLQKALETALQSDNLVSMGENARQRADSFSWKASAFKIQNIYSDILS